MPTYPDSLWSVNRKKGLHQYTSTIRNDIAPPVKFKPNEIFPLQVIRPFQTVKDEEQRQDMIGKNGEVSKRNFKV
jgi:hypothetical protein